MALQISINPAECLKGFYRKLLHIETERFNEHSDMRVLSSGREIMYVNYKAIPTNSYKYEYRVLSTRVYQAILRNRMRIYYICWLHIIFQ